MEGKTYHTDPETVPYDGDDFCGEIMHFKALVHSGRKESLIMSLQDSLTCAHICEKIRDTFMHWRSAYI